MLTVAVSADVIGTSCDTLCEGKWGECPVPTRVPLFVIKKKKSHKKNCFDNNVYVTKKKHTHKTQHDNFSRKVIKKLNYLSAYAINKHPVSHLLP